MLFSFAALALSSALVASATDINVLVGDGGQLAFNPTNVQAQVGDTVRFEFRAKNHSVTQSTFATPCAKSANGIDSGFFLIADGATEHPSWSFTVDNATAPLWFFCGQTNPVNHCQMGMVFAVNAPPDKNFDMYQANAKNSLVAAAGAPGASGSIAPGASGSDSIIAPPTSLPTGGVIPGASASVPFVSGFSTSSPAIAFPTSGGSTASSALPSDSAAAAAGAAPNGALAVRGASSGVAVGAVTFVALAAGLLL